MSILILMSQYNSQPVAEAFNNLSENREILVWPDVKNWAGIQYAVVWKPEPGVLSELSGLRAIFSFGAGVDHIVQAPNLPSVPIVRFVEPDLTQRMTEYVTLHVLYHHRQMNRYADYQKNRIWKDLDQVPATDVKVGVMGLGVLGSNAALVLKSLGFHVSGWSLSRKKLSGITCYAGQEELDQFLENCEILVCLLPLTKLTKGLLNKNMIARLGAGNSSRKPALINAGRGELQNEHDIVSALNNGTLRGASLDVFQSEPLHIDDQLWKTPNLIITPHNASTSDAMSVAKYVLRQISNLEHGKQLEHVVDRSKGY